MGGERKSRRRKWPRMKVVFQVQLEAARERVGELERGAVPPSRREAGAPGGLG